ncbi:substrate-binding periplasmic protein [Desulfoluna spongiiphila]|uniref:Amino acid ABC transporter substrate-binding protein, PAAT family n=1 Tax=Desulfoluna spongiiphila TaxID=419481 RepID=A0A1G5EMP2_9BACT|nr:transporter substrate-binding domain-containing protein [Desulfoluna spongiiphila]SCY28267.1 amino acid ABC transporter substrate-binding protein, PAAT family [Desulfoluna spongiiphila]
MKRATAAILSAFCILCFGISAHAQTQVLNIASDNDWPPYEWVDKETKELKGFAPEVVTHVLKTMDVPFEIKPYPWKRAERNVLEGKSDALFPASRKAKREKTCHYPGIDLLKSEYCFFIRKEDQGKLTFTDFSDLKGHKIGVSSGYSYTTEFWEFLKANKNYTEAKTDELNLKKLVKGRFDYFPGEVGNVAVLAKQLGIEDKIVRLPKPITQKPYYIIFNKAKVDEAFVHQFSDALEAYKKSQEYQAIYTKYFN